MTCTAHDHRSVVDHLLEGHRDRRRMALDDHSKGISDEQTMHSSLVEHHRRGMVIRREHGDLLTTLFHPLKGSNVDGCR